MEIVLRQIPQEENALADQLAKMASALCTSCQKHSALLGRARVFS